jgi:hypothetical protein
MSMCRMRAIYSQRIWLTICAVCLLLASVTASGAQKLSCESILKDAYDRTRGLVVWDDFPKLGALIRDPEGQYFVDRGGPLAEAIWRFLNDISNDEKFRITSYFAMRLKSIKDVDELWGDKALYVPLSKISGSSRVSDEKVEVAARQVLKSRIDAGSAIITSYNFDIREDGKVVRAAFVSPVIKNTPPDGPSLSDLAVAFLEVFTNLRIEDSVVLREELTKEYSAGCLQKFSKQCVMFDIARNMYRHANKLKTKAREDVAIDICGYVHAE